MTSVDWGILGLMVISALIAFIRGLVREVLTVGAWLGAGALSYALTPVTRPYVSRYVPSPEWTDPAATYILLFLIWLIALSLVAKTIGHVVRHSAIGGVDRSLGLVFGLARGSAVTIAVYLVASMVVLPAQWPEPVLESRSLPIMCKGAAWVAGQLVARGLMDQSSWEKIQECPGPRQTTADSILNTSPTGRAFDPPLRR
jgi:membrane protein required for colicin V production